MSCQTLIESELISLPGVKSVKVDFKTGTCFVDFDADKIRLDKIKEIIVACGYGLDQNKFRTPKNFWLGFLIPIFLGGLILIYYLLFQTNAFSLLARLNEKNLSLGLIFLIGVLASFHCVGMCGGIVLAYSTANAKEQMGFDKYRPHILYNLGRVISYTLVGALLGGLGSFFSFTPTLSGTIMIIAGLIMLGMALNLATDFYWLKRINNFLPLFFAKFIFSQAKNKKGPFLIGFLTALMPCGPLQAMQLYALASGSYLIGGLSLFVYSLGTVFLMFIFGILASTLTGRLVSKALKVSALLVAVLAVLMLTRGFLTLGILDFGQKSEITQSSEKKDYQIVRMKITSSGYQPNTLYVKKGVWVRWVIDGSGISGCTNAIQIPSLGIKKNLSRGENVIEFLPEQSGEIPFSCWMSMVWGKFIVE